MTKFLLTTRRLRLSPFEETDLDLLTQLHREPEVNRFLSPGPKAMKPEDIRRRLSDYVDAHRKTGMSKWKLETANGTFVGRAGFSRLEDPDGFEMGYSLLPSAWGRGYASEIAIALVAWFFDNRSEEVLLAFAVSENAASLRVMEKAGLAYWMDKEKFGQPCTFYRITRKAYLRRQSRSYA